MSFRFLSPALDELAEAAEFYEQRVPGLGADFIRSEVPLHPEALAEIRRKTLKVNGRMSGAKSDVAVQVFLIYTILPRK